jgi:flavin-dependent dehydrogenase
MPIAESHSVPPLYGDPAEPVDVVILGGGFAGLTLALHLSIHLPEVSVALVEPSPTPPRFTHKVGESSLGPQGSYLVQWLQLEDYIQQSHVLKFGTRYFFKDGNPSPVFADRPEVGSRELPTEFKVHEFQVDRGKLEADLRDMIVAKGVTWLPYRATKVTFGEDGAAHTVALRDPETEEAKTLSARWVVDASGRRRLLHSQRHGATDRSASRCSSAWFRVPGWVDVDDFVPAEATEWHRRVSNEHPAGVRFGRVNSTTHVSGPGYWVWLIPLPDDVMSVGIAAMEELVPFESYNTAERALRWLAENEPDVAAAVEGREMLDFRFLRRYSHPVVDFISTERWALCGDALGFADPFYSPGGDMISLANLIIVESIRRERNGTLDEATCRQLTANMRRHQATVTDAIQSTYPCLGASRVAGAHVVMDFFSLVTPMVGVVRGFGPAMYDFLASDEGTRVVNELAAIRDEMNALMLSWLTHEKRYQPAGSMFDHGVKLDELISQIWIDPTGKDLAVLANHWLEGVKAVADKYRTRGLEWDFFDPSVYAGEPAGA